MLFHFCLPSLLGSNLKEKHLFLLEQILSLKSSPLSRKASSYREANRKLRKLLPFVKIAETYEGVPIYLKLMNTKGAFIKQSLYY